MTPLKELEKRLKAKKLALNCELKVAEEKKTAFADESTILRRSHIELINEILTWIKDLMKQNQPKA